MKILRVIDTLDLRTGGPAAGLRALTPVLRELGHETVIVTVDGPTAPTDLIPGTKIINLGPARGSYRLASALQPWLRRHVGEFDAVFVHGLWQNLGRSVHLATRDRAVPYFVYPHGMLDPWFRFAFPRKHVKKWLYWQLVERHVLRDAAAVLFTCEQERQLARRSFAPYECTERVVNYGTAGAPPGSEAQMESWFGRQPTLRFQPYLLFLGRIHPKKGVDLLLDAYLRLAAGQSRPPALVVAGPAENAELLQHLQARAAAAHAPARVIWAGMIEGDPKWGALRGAEAVVLPSHQENFGLSVVEALSVGTPVLLSDQVNIWREIVADGAGLAAPDTAEGTASLLREWQAISPGDRLAWRQRATRCYESRFHIAAVARSFLEVIQPFLSPAVAPLP